MNPLNDRTAEEKLPQNKDIVTFLQHTTTSSDTLSQETKIQAIARVRSRLLEEGQLNMEDELDSIVPLQERIETRQMASTVVLRKRPLWQKHLSLLVAVLCVALIVGSFVAVEQLARHNSTTTGSSSQNNPHSKGGQYVYFPIVEVHMKDSKFRQSSVVIPKGTGIEFISDDHVMYVLSNGYWKNAEPVALKEKGIPKVDFAIVSRQVVGPFNTPGTYHLYDDIHEGANLIVTVQK